MKYVLLKTIVIVMYKLIRSNILRGSAGLCGAPKGGDGGKKISLVMQGEAGMG